MKAAVAAMVLAAGLAIALGAVRVAQQHEIIRLGYQLADATAELEREREENRRLRLEKSVLTHPERIERLARALGMQRPGRDQIRAVRADEPRAERAGR
jgi:cell division protein FtsL